MTTLQEYLNEEYRTLKAKGRVREINISGYSSDTLKYEEVKQLEGGNLSLSEYPNLEKVVIKGYYLKSKLTSLDISNCIKLIELNCSGNQLTNLDLTNYPNLVMINCASNRITDINVNNLDKLANLSCQRNQITNLNIKGCAGLKKLNYPSNPLFEDFSANQTFVNSLDFTNYPFLKKDSLLNWKAIHQDFAKEDNWDKTCQQEWEEKGLTYQDAQKWIKADLKPKEHEFANWEHSNLLTEELAQWRKISQQKEQVKDQSPQSYDLARSDLAILWRKQLYFITSFQYISNWKLSVQIRAKKCPLSLYYWNWMRTAGIGYLEKGQVIDDKNQRMHYEFCDDLSIKKIYQKELGYQPKFALFQAISEGKDLTWSTGTQDKKMNIPTNIQLELFNQTNSQGLMSKVNELANKIPSLITKITKPGEAIGDLIQTILNQKVNLVVGCDEMPVISGHYLGLGQPSLFQKSFEKEDILFTDKPEWAKKFKKQPHLWDHTTFQFYFFGEEITPANARFLKIRAKDSNGQEVKDWESQPEKVSYFTLPYKVFISNSPGNLHYRLEFEYINVKLGVKTQGVFQGNSVFNYLTQIQVEAATFGGGLSWNEDKGQLQKLNKKEKSKENKKAKEEKKSADKSDKDKPTDSMFDSNPLNFNFSLGEFFTRLTSPILMYRIVISELLYNRLGWANNKQKALNLPTQWPAYGEFSQKLGEWKWREVKLESDFQGFFKERMEQGYILTDGGKLTKPNFGYEKWGDYIKVPGSAWDIFVAEEEVIEKREQIKETLMTADMSNAQYGIADYIGSPDANIWAEMGHRVHPTSYGNGGGKDCLGCLCGGGSHGNPNYNFSQVYNFTSGGTLELKTQGSGVQTCIIPPQGGKVTFSAQGSSGSIVLETEKITRETRFKEAKKVHSQEIDQNELETKEEEKEFENEGEIDLENTEQEKSDQGLGEKSQEKEYEKEQEEEQETEKEDENEKETEGEKEDENEKTKEQEQTNEEEKVDEDENEDEGEREGEEEDEL